MEVAAQRLSEDEVRAVIDHTFQRFIEDVQKRSGASIRYHHREALTQIELPEIIIDATFTLELEHLDQWNKIEEMCGPEGSRRPYIQVFELMHYWPYRSLYEVVGHRISVRPTLGVHPSYAHYKPGVAEIAHLSVAFRIKRTRSEIPKQRQNPPSRPRKWV